MYPNEPPCPLSNHGEHFWGENYEALVKLKDDVDPGRLFSFCQGVGSTQEDCCPGVSSAKPAEITTLLGQSALFS